MEECKAFSDIDRTPDDTRNRLNIPKNCCKENRVCQLLVASTASSNGEAWIYPELQNPIFSSTAAIHR